MLPAPLAKLYYSLINIDSSTLSALATRTLFSVSYKDSALINLIIHLDETPFQPSYQHWPHFARRPLSENVVFFTRSPYRTELCPGSPNSRSHRQRSQSGLPPRPRRQRALHFSLSSIKISRYQRLLCQHLAVR